MAATCAACRDIVEYKAPVWLPGGDLQTIYPATCIAKPPVAFRRERWDTPDGDFVDVDFVDGAPGSPWVHLYHGLEGSSNSPYARMLMSYVVQRGWRGSVFHFRGCSGEPNRLPRAYHSGDTEEIAISRLHDDGQAVEKRVGPTDGLPLRRAGEQQWLATAIRVARDDDALVVENGPVARVDEALLDGGWGHV